MWGKEGRRDGGNDTSNCVSATHTNSVAIPPLPTTKILLAADNCF